MRITLLALAAVATTGCLSSNSYQTAQTLPQGDFELGVAASVTYVPGFCVDNAMGNRDCFGHSHPSGESPALDDRWVGTIPFEVLGRVGLADRVDLGARIALFGARLDIKFQLVDTQYFDLALGVGGRVDTVELAGFVPLVLSTRVVDWMAFYGGAQFLFAQISGSDGPDSALVAGIAGNFGASFDYDGVSIRPEVTYNRYLHAFSLPAGATAPSFSYVSMGVGALYRFD